jgi:rsbT co-antagonist protein RsbR
MNSGIEQFVAIWRKQGDVFVDQLIADVATRAGPAYTVSPHERLREVINQTVQTWWMSLEANDPAALVDFTQKVVRQQVEDDFTIKQTMWLIDMLRKHIWQLMSQVYAAGDWDMDVVEHVERWLHEQRKAVLGPYNEVLQEARERLSERERAFEDQSQLIQELSTPIMPIHEGVLVLPMVGAVDSRRATQVMESVLERIVEYQADVVILDITGVPIVDTNVANHLLQMARAVKLLGAQIVLVGIGAEIAQTIVQLGVDLGGVTTRSNLQSGIEYALAEKGFAIGAAGA